MEKPEQNRHLLRDFSPEDDPTDDIHSRRHSFWRVRPWWQYLVLLQMVNILFIALLESRGSIAHHISRARDPVASDYWDLFESRTSSRYKGIDEGYWTRLTNKTLRDYYVLAKHGVVALDDSHLTALNETKVPHPTTPPLLPDDVKGMSLYQVGVFHSMHCIDMIYQQLINPSPFTPPLDCTDLQLSSFDREKYPLGLQMACHAQHCVDWIRQDIACLADPTLESLIDSDHPAQHQCRSFEQVRGWALENQYKGDFSNLYEFG